MRINRNELLSILQKIKPAISKRNIIEQFTHFVFTGSEVYTFDDFISIRHPFNTDFKCSVPGDEFYKILSEIDCKEVQIKIQDNNLLLTTNKIDMKLCIMTDIDKIKLKKEKRIWKKLPNGFLNALSFCSFSASRDMTKQALTYLDVCEDKITSSDNYRVTQYKMNGKVEIPFHFPATAVKDIIKYKVTRYAITDKWLYFKTKDEIIFSCRRSTISFPDVSKLLNMKGEEINLPEETKKAVDISSILCQGDIDLDKKIEVVIKEGQMICIGSNEIGNIKFYIKAKELRDKEFGFGINPDFLKMILNKSTRVIIDKKRILFLSNNFKHLISLF